MRPWLDGNDFAQLGRTSAAYRDGVGATHASVGTAASGNNELKKQWGRVVDLGLDDKVILVSGATGGIGRATATLFLEEGSRVMLSARSAECDALAFHELSHRFGERCAYVSADLEQIDGPAHTVEATLDTFGRIDGAVVNGVPTPMGKFSDTSNAELLGRLEGKAVACA